MDETIERSAAAITIIANGQTRSVRTGSTIGDLLHELTIVPERVVVQLDGVIIPRGDFSRTGLHQGSRLEVVTLVGGG